MQMRRALCLLLSTSLVACARGDARQQDTVLVFVAASLTNALKPQLDSFTARTGTTVLTESGASMEHIRKITDLHRVPDLIVLADDDLFGRTLSPRYVSWWASFATNRMVIAYTDRSRGHDSITAKNWYKLLAKPGVEVGRSDPVTAPVGYRALVIFTLSELAYKDKGLAARLLANAAPKNIRSNAAELAALLAAGELDYIYDYESVARANGFQFIRLPSEVAGLPVTYALSIPLAAHNAPSALKLVQYIESDTVRSRLRALHIDMLDAPQLSGNGAPILFAPSGH